MERRIIISSQLHHITHFFSTKLYNLHSYDWNISSALQKGHLENGARKKIEMTLSTLLLIHSLNVHRTQAAFNGFIDEVPGWSAPQGGQVQHKVIVDLIELVKMAYDYELQGSYLSD